MNVKDIIGHFVLLKTDIHAFKNENSNSWTSKKDKVILVEDSIVYADSIIENTKGSCYLNVLDKDLQKLECFYGYLYSDDLEREFKIIS